MAQPDYIPQSEEEALNYYRRPNDAPPDVVIGYCKNGDNAGRWYWTLPKESPYEYFRFCDGRPSLKNGPPPPKKPRWKGPVAVKTTTMTTQSTVPVLSTWQMHPPKSSTINPPLPPPAPVPSPTLTRDEFISTVSMLNTRMQNLEENINELRAYLSSMNTNIGNAFGQLIGNHDTVIATFNDMHADMSLMQKTLERLDKPKVTLKTDLFGTGDKNVKRSLEKTDSPWIDAKKKKVIPVSPNDNEDEEIDSQEDIIDVIKHNKKK